MADNFTQEKLFTNAKKTNWIIKHFKNGALQREDPFVAGVLSGLVRVYGADGELTAQLTADKGTLHGPAKYYKFGQVVREVVFEHGQPKVKQA